MNTVSYTKKSSLSGLLMVLPYFLFFCVFSLYPMLFGIKISFYDWALLGERKFVGFKNYVNVFSDEETLQSIWHTVLFVILTVPILVLVGLLLAILVNQVRKGQSFFRATIFLPMMLSVSVMASIWKVFLQPYSGLLNVLLKYVGLKSEIFWLSDPALATASVVMSTVWWTVGFVFVLYLAGLQDIPQSYYEAGQIEGANRFQSFWHITLPSLSRITVLVIILQTIASFKIFGQAKLLTNGGPAGATRTIVFQIYDNGFHSFHLGYASAISVMLMLFICIISILQFTLLREKQ